jgi:predicted CxxxxCH...CXXCH cytochrome family protein
MLIRQGRWKSIFGFSTEQNAGVAKLAVLLSLAAFVVFFIFTVRVQQTKAADCDCGYCHGSNHHGDNWSGCSACHDSPPQTGTHLIHYNSAATQVLSYGDTSVTSTDGAYKFGCGNCHPLDNTKHRNGIVEVELYDAAAPSGSLKVKNPPDAEYTAGANISTYPHKVEGQPDFSYSDGTCSKVYCHSGYTVTSGNVGNPLTYPANPVPPGYKLNIVTDYYTGLTKYIMDETCSNLTYAPYTVNYQRVYATTPPWGTNSDGLNTTFTTCKECHEFPLTTYTPEVQKGVGDGHQWLSFDDYWGEWYNYGHAYNMGYFDPIPCRACHYGTVAELGSTYVTEGLKPYSYIIAYNPVQLASRIMHVNGTPDVGFDTVNGVRFYNYWGYCSGPWDPTCPIDYTYGLQAATYDSGTKTCSNVSCHYDQTSPPYGASKKWQNNVKWGAPQDQPFGSAKCDICHRSTILHETCTNP